MTLLYAALALSVGMTSWLVACRARPDDLNPPAPDRRSAAERQEVPAVLRAFHATDFPFEGTWLRSREPTYACEAIEIRDIGEGRYSIDYVDAMDCGVMGRSFEVVWSGVALKSVDGAYPRALHPVRIDGQEAFIPDELLPTLVASWTDQYWYAAFWRADEKIFKAFKSFLDRTREPEPSADPGVVNGMHSGSASEVTKPRQDTWLELFWQG